MTDPKRLKEALDVACHNLALSFDAADENVEAYETIRAHLATFDEREAFVEAAREFGSMLDSLEPDDSKPDKTPGGGVLRALHVAYRALVAKEHAVKEGK